MQFTEACMNKLEAMIPSVVNNLLMTTLIEPETRRSTRNKKRNVTIIDESHFDSALLVSPVAKRRKVTPSTTLPLYMPQIPEIERDARHSLGTLARRYSNLIQSQPYHTIDVKVAAELLQVEKRRLYDVINIFEGTKLVIQDEQGSYRWVDQQLKHRLGNQIEQLCEEELQLDHWIELFHAQTDVIYDLHPDLHVTSNQLQRILPQQETLLAIVSPPGSHLFSDASQPEVFTIRLPTSNVLPQVFLMETNQHQIVNLDLEEAFIPAPPLLDTCASGLTIGSAMWDVEKNQCSQQGFLSLPLVSQSSSAAANVA